MNILDELLKLNTQLDEIFRKVINGNKDVLDEIDNLLLQVVNYDNDLEDEVIKSSIDTFSTKLNLIYKLIGQKENENLNIVDLENEFKSIELERFNIVNNYVMGIVKIDEINNFKEHLFKFRDKLYSINFDDKTILKIAKMKSKVQHFNTEILEDEEMLKMAYANVN